MKDSLRTSWESRGLCPCPDCPASCVALDKHLASLGLSLPTGSNEDIDFISLGPSGSGIIDTGSSGQDLGGQGGACDRRCRRALFFSSVLCPFR